MKTTGILICAAAAGFFVLFSPWTQQAPFWPVMTAMAAVLAGASLAADWPVMRGALTFRKGHAAAGVLSALVLYSVFAAGYFVSVRILPFAGRQVGAIYHIRPDQNLWLIAAALIFVIGPAEEIFWRGFVQRRLSSRWGVLPGFVMATAVYALVHIWSFNFMLIAAAAVAGGFWGLMYAATGKLWPVIISHAVWDFIIFILWPIGQAA